MTNAEAARIMADLLRDKTLSAEEFKSRLNDLVEEFNK